jgi:ketosteroid isomerase-like protein
MHAQEYKEKAMNDQSNSRNIQDVVTEWYRSIEQGRVDHVVSMMTDDIVGEMPYSPGDFPKILRGIPAHRHHFANGIAGYRQISFIDFRFWPMQDPEYVGLQCHGRFIRNNDAPYENNYFCIYRVVGGKVAWWIEYYDPQVFLTAHGGMEGACEQYAVDAD